jgi:magnesium-transporting ATPase (P-type)
LKTRKTNRLKSNKRFEEMKDFSTSRQGKLWGEREREIDLRAVVRCYPKVGNQRLPGSCGQILLINLLSHSPVPSYIMTSVFQVKSTEGERSSQNGTEIHPWLKCALTLELFFFFFFFLLIYFSFWIPTQRNHQCEAIIYQKSNLGAKSGARIVEESVTAAGSSVILQRLTYSSRIFLFSHLSFLKRGSFTEV